MLKIAQQVIHDDVSGVTLEIREDRILIWRHAEAVMPDGSCREIGIGEDGLESFAGTHLKGQCPSTLLADDLVDFGVWGVWRDEAVTHAMKALED